jgi:hypothetical protein
MNKGESRIPLKINSHEQIDKMVYQLYGLTEEEIKIVEGSDS